MWEFQLAEIAGSDVGLGIAFLAGVIAFFSPCVLPILPVYISYFTGMNAVELRELPEDQQKKLFRNTTWQAIAFVVGFLLIFMLLGLASGSLGGLLSFCRSKLQYIGGALFMFLGVYLLELLPIPWLYKQAKINAPINLTRWKIVNALVAGLLFGFAWTPCIGPVLATILFIATFAGGSVYGVLLLAFFALGLGLPFILLALTIQWTLPLIRKYMFLLVGLQKIAGVLLVLLGLLMITGLMTRAIQYLLGFSQPLL